MPAQRVRPPGGHVLLRGVVQRLDGQADRRPAVEVGPPPLLHRPPSVEGARPGRVIVGLLPPPAGDVVSEQPAEPPPFVEPGEQRHHDQPLEGHREVLADHLGQAIGLAVEREALSLHLLVVLELGLEQAHHLGGLAGCAGDGDAGVVVGREHLLDALVGDREAFDRPAVAGHHHPVREPEGEHGGPVRDPRRRLGRPAGALGQAGLRGGVTHQVEKARVGAEAVRRAPGEGTPPLRHSPPFWT